MQKREARVQVVKLARVGLVSEKGVEAVQIDPTLLRQNLGDQQVSLVHVLAEEPSVVVGGYEALICATAKRARWVWAACWRDAEELELGASTDADLLSLIPRYGLIWM